MNPPDSDPRERCSKHPDGWHSSTLSNDEPISFCWTCGQEKIEARMVALRAELRGRGLQPGGVAYPTTAAVLAFDQETARG